VVAVTSSSSHFGIFTPDMLRALRRALDATAPAAETEEQRRQRACRLLYAAQFGRQTGNECRIADLLPGLREEAKLFVHEGEEADRLVEDTLRLAISVADDAPTDPYLGRWLSVLLATQARDDGRR
jgi:hypothetical protein